MKRPLKLNRSSEDARRSTAEQLLALCRFAEIGPRVMDLLAQRFGGPEDILRVSPEALRAIDGMTEQQVEQITGAADRLPEAREYYRELQSRDIDVVTRFDPAFPHKLMDLNDPPPLLYTRGNLPQNDRKTVTLMGSGNPTNEGIELTVEMGKRFAEAGVQVVASVRSGIDSSAHLGCRAAEGDEGQTAASFAVLDSGLNEILPTESIPLAIDIAQEGGVISEYAPEADFEAWHFEQTNRLLVGVSHAVVVTEIYTGDELAMDMLQFSSQIGQLVFLIIDPRYGALVDEDALNQAVTYGAIPLVGLERIQDIIDSLV
jgi:DNA processing protein